MGYGVAMRQAANTYPIGIDMGDRYLTAAQFRKTRRGLRLRSLYCQPLEASDMEDDAMLIAALKSVVSSGFFKGSRAVVNLPFHDLSVFPVHFLLGEQDDPEEAILREALKFLPYPLEEAIIDYPSLIKQSGACDATIVAVRRQVMVRWLGILRSAGLTAEVMEFSVSSLMRLHQRLFPNDNRIDLLCHIGRAHSLLAVATVEGLLCLSEIPWGIQPLWNRISSHLELTGASAEAIDLLKVYGLAYAERETLPDNMPGGNAQETMHLYRVIFQIIAPAVEELVYEVHKTIGYLRSLHDHAVFGNIYLYGLAGLISQLDCFLEKHTGIPVQTVDALAILGSSDSDRPTCLPEWISPVPALGLAMREVSWL